MSLLKALAKELYSVDNFELEEINSLTYGHLLKPKADLVSFSTMGYAMTDAKFTLKLWRSNEKHRKAFIAKLDKKIAVIKSRLCSAKRYNKKHRELRLYIELKRLEGIKMNFYIMGR